MLLILMSILMGGGSYDYPHFIDGEAGPAEATGVAQGHVPGKEWSWDSDPALIGSRSQTSDTLTDFSLFLVVVSP